MKKICFFVLGVCLLAFPAQAQIQRDYKIVAPHTIEGKNYYFTSLLQHFADADSLIRTSSALMQMAQDKQQRLEKANTTEARVAAMKFSEEEMAKAADALAGLYKPDNALGRILSRHIIPSGCYQQYKETGADLVRKIWRQDAEGMNYAIDVYAAARKPNYPAIDSIGFDVRSRRFVHEILPACQQNIVCWNSASPAFYSVPLKAVRVLLDVNDRSQALDYEPLGETENKKAYAQIKLTDWDAYPYTAILVLGAGPEDPREAISPEGRLRSAYAAMLYRQHQAPFIILSGGRVHPYHTPYNEAREMKRYLMEVWQVPESAIIMEPHARHTTTNYRNAARIMLRCGFPADRYALSTSSESHINDVASETSLPQRCLRELGFVPYRAGKRLSARVIEFVPLPESFIIDPTEPIDP